VLAAQSEIANLTQWQDVLVTELARVDILLMGGIAKSNFKKHLADMLFPQTCCFGMTL